MSPPFTAVDAADARLLRDAFGCFPSGVAAVCSLVDGEPTGMAVSSFTSVSLDPPLVSVCVDNESTTWRRLRAAGRIGVSVLSEAHEAVCRSLAARTGDRFAGLTLHTTVGGAVLIEGATAWLDCMIQDEIPAGDHHIVLLRIAGLRTGPETRPLVFHQSGFRRLIEVPT
ncbi:flavin reductase family protein [Saccharopolyspora sp. K220]|nr:flavin reductase family protein [Saccharopolyspora soli]